MKIAPPGLHLRPGVCLSPALVIYGSNIEVYVLKRSFCLLRKYSLACS